MQRVALKRLKKKSARIIITTRIESLTINLDAKMSLSKYLKSIAKEGAVSENALYAALKTHLICGLLNYPAAHVYITPSKKKTGKKKSIAEKFGIPDLQLKSADNIFWIVGEAKLSDDEIRNDKKRNALWQDKMIDRHYIGAETFYVLLCAPKTFYLYDVRYNLQAGLHIEDNSLIDIVAGTSVEATEKEFQRLFRLASYEESEAQPQFQRFRTGELPSGHIPIIKETLPQLEDAFTRSLSELKAYCKTYFESLKTAYDATYTPDLLAIDKKIEDAGGDRRRRRGLNLQRYRLRSKFAVHRKLFEDDYPHFRDAQAYSGTEKEEDFQDVFITNTCHIALSRLIFVRIAEDMGMTKKRISNAGIAVWASLADNLRESYQDVVEFTFRQVEPLYTKLFETTAFDWYGEGNGDLSRVLERTLFRLNAFNFNAVNRDILGAIYQSFRPRIERKRLGEYYTEDTVVDFILHETGIAADELILSKKILDPACGSFTFGVRAAQVMLERAKQLSPENRLQAVRETLYGADINAFSVFISHLSLFFTTLDLYRDAKSKNAQYDLQGFNLVSQNSLFSAASISDDEFSEQDIDFPKKFDYIVGNPPFVRNERLPEDDRRGLDAAFEDVRSGNTDLSTFFVYAMLKDALKERGILGFVLPSAIANADSTAKLREFILKHNSLIEVVTLEWLTKEIFPDASTTPIILIVQRGKSANTNAVRLVNGIRSIDELRRAVDDKKFLAAHTSVINVQDYAALSPSKEWCLEITERDVKIVQTMRSKETLSKICRTQYALTVGSNGGESATRAIAEASALKATELPFLKAQSLYAFGVDEESTEAIDIEKFDKVRGQSIWKNLKFYRENRDKFDTTGLGRADYESFGLFNSHLPTDSLVCVTGEISLSNFSAVINPAIVCFNNTAIVTTPYMYSAHVVCAIINSLPVRYYAFTAMRSTTIQGGYFHIYPRTIDNLPLPNLTDETAEALHQLSLQAHEISKSASQTPEDAFLKEITKGKNQKAGLLGIQWESDAETFDADELETARLDGKSLILESVTFTAPTTALCELLFIALRCESAEELRVDSVQDILLPKENHDSLAASLRATAENLRTAETRMKVMTDKIDELVAEGLGVSIEAIRARCNDFPLSETVMKPRYVWSSDRRRQARRSYEKGKRFK